MPPQKAFDQICGTPSGWVGRKAKGGLGEKPATCIRLAHPWWKTSTAMAPAMNRWSGECRGHKVWVIAAILILRRAPRSAKRALARPLEPGERLLVIGQIEVLLGWRGGGAATLELGANLQHVAEAL